MTNKIEINGEIYIKESDITPEFKDQLAKDSLNPFEVGKPYFFRTVTFAYVGKLEAVYDNELVLSNCTWVANTGRFSDAMNKGFNLLESSELEPFNKNQKVIISRGGIIDASVWLHDLPTEQK
jgi:hypothetical protein